MNVPRSSTIDAFSYINGEYVSGEDRFSRENPANTGEIVGTAPKNTREDTRKAIDVAAQAFPSWAKTPVQDRVDMLRRAGEKMKNHIPEWKEILTREHGKVLWDSESELLFSCGFIEFGANMINLLPQDQVIEDERGRLLITRRPIGVVSAITPWNYPVVLAIMKVVPALLTGNTMVIKPSPFAPLTISKALGLIAEELPPGVLNLVHGFAEVGEEMASNPKVGKVTFTGSAKTARQIMKSCSETIKKMTLELGGNDPAVLLEDVDLSEESMRKLVIGTFLTSGQVCMAAKRIYVQESIYEPFMESFQAASNRWLKVGNGLNAEATIGPMNNKAQKEYVEELVNEARKNGATVYSVGKMIDPEVDRNGYFLQPTIIVNANQSDRIVAEEQFGPTVPVLKFKTEEEAVKLANDSNYGLSASVWSRDLERATRVAQQIKAGWTFINTHNLAGVDIRAPFGGCKQSGIGVECGIEGFTEYLEFRVINAPKSGVMYGAPQ